MRNEGTGTPLSGAHPFSADTGDGPRGHMTLIRAENANFPRKYYRHRSSDPIGKHESCLHVRSYTPPNWFTAAGVHRKRKQIEARGLPAFYQWRFITLTLDPSKFGECPRTAYLSGKAKLRKFMFLARRSGLWADDAKWCWKLEFTSCGWAHWHLLVGRTAKFSEAEMAKLSELWGLGRVNVEMVRTDDFLYSFKYAFKPVSQVEDSYDDTPSDVQDNCSVPNWFLDYVGTQTVKVKGPDGSVSFEEKPVTFARTRFWQTSKDFYTGQAPTVASNPGEPEKAFVPHPARVQLERQQTTVQIVARKKSGRYIASAVVGLTCITGKFWDRVGFDAFCGGSVGLAVNSFVVPASIIESKIAQPWHLQPILKQNRLSLHRAAVLQRHRVDLRTC